MQDSILYLSKDAFKNFYNFLKSRIPDEVIINYYYNNNLKGDSKFGKRG